MEQKLPLVKTSPRHKPPPHPRRTKTRKLFSIFQKAGFVDCYYQPCLDQLILASGGLDDGSDETFEFYSYLMEKHSAKIEPDRDSSDTR